MNSNLSKSKERQEKEIKTRPWTEKDKHELISLYAYTTDKELCGILEKTSGQLRGMKERMGLNQKLKLFTDEEKSKIEAFYRENKNELNLSDFAKDIGRPKTSISRYANQLNLTNDSRPHTEIAINKLKKSLLEYMKSDRYPSEIKKRQKRLLAYYMENDHPKGMLNKHHSDDTKRKMSISHIILAEKMSYEEKHQIAMKAVATKRKNNGFNTTANTYSRCRGGFRKDIGKYFRSSWEANFVRLLNHFNIDWVYEVKRFNFDGETCDVLSYQPDFYLPQYNKWIEVKGWMDSKSKRRLELFQLYYPEEYLNLIVIDEKIYSLLEKQYSGCVIGWETKNKKNNLISTDASISDCPFIKPPKILGLKSM